MQLNELVKKISRLPDVKQQEVIDFVAFLEARYASNTAEEAAPNWSDQQFKVMSLDQAMQGLADEPDIYTDADIKERWS